MRNVDIDGITHGTAQFGIDIRLPGMKYASVERCPVLLGKAVTYDATEAVRTDSLGSGPFVITSTLLPVTGGGILDIVFEPPKPTVYFNAATTTAAGPLNIAHVTELTFSPAFGAWKVTAYRALTTRKAGTGATTTTASQAGGTTTTTKKKP